ncbi:2-amino-4-hydroxy-6-hydroxymethyldihydropteridine diphosphokinase [Candidiatus Paracoxiella cheracis]|uniref:2-amino-4-hydroxy-6- hydroxymethyldihydropteridine diphosphokinase n=1 Tax=Candidiatus Paracoxiella cheracis TaxID=3405120 RepID=UPI003BF54B84
MVNAYIGIGSNLSEPLQQVRAAIASLKKIPDSHVSRVSSFYRSKPLGQPDQPDFINAVASVNTALDPHELLDYLQAIEQQQGRLRDGVRWGPRTIDLDMLLFGDIALRTDDLQIPHPGLVEREFVLYPLAEIAPDLVLPDGTTVRTLRARCSSRGIMVEL